MSEQFSDVERRAVQVHGAAASAFLAATEMFGDLVPDTHQFLGFLRLKCERASEQRELAVNVNQFWVDLISAFQRGVFGKTAPEQRRFFRVKSRTKDYPPGAVTKDEHGNYVQGPWDEWTLYIETNGVTDELRKDMRQGGKTMVLDKSDLIEQISRRPYYNAGNRTRYGVKHRFGGKYGLKCLVIDVDAMDDFGYRQVSDEVFEESLYTQQRQQDLPGTETRVRIASDKWIDPRKGDIFTIIDAVASKGKEDDE